MLEVRDPASDETIASLPMARASDATAAVRVASDALASWRERRPDERAAVLAGAAEAMERDLEALARTVTLECGKPLSEARGEVRYAADYLRSAAEQAQGLLDETFDARRAGVRAVAVREPIGVCAAVTPWNFPIAMLARKVAPALAAGCTMVAKPDEKWGETPCAFIELKAGASATKEEIVAWCLEHLARFKAPRHVVFTELPKTATGKIQKFRLRDLAKDA